MRRSPEGLFKSKKAQITIFIIIGIILLFSSALILYIKNKVTNTTPPPTVIQSVPEELMGMKKYIESCIYQTGKQAVELIGAHGGYIYPDDFDIDYNAAKPTEANGLEVFQNTKYVVPYWYYLKSENTNPFVAFDSKKPPLIGDDESSIEYQITDYVDKNLKTCINNFITYKEMGYDVTELGDIDTKTTITREEVVIDVTWPLEAGRTDPKKMDRFLVVLPVNLRQIYNFAGEIMVKTSESKIFEVNTMNLLTYTNKEQLPPLADFSFKLKDFKTWSLKTSQDTVENILLIYTPMLRIMNTLNGFSYGYGNMMTDTIFEKMEIRLDEMEVGGKFYPLNVDFRYSKNWPIYFDVTPRTGDMIRSKDSMGALDFLQYINIRISQNEFFYDMSYPLLIKLEDPKAFNGEGYSFIFATEVNVRDNKPLRANITANPTFGLQQFYACDEAQKRSGNITVNVFDAITKKPIGGAEVMFSFAKKGCQMGLTKLNNDTASVTERLPKGMGTLSVSHPDYASNLQLYGVSDNKTDNISIYLYPIIEKNVTLKMYHMKKNVMIARNTNLCFGTWKFNETILDLEQNETMDIFITKIKEPDSPDMIFNTLNFNGSTKNDSVKTIRLLPGKYKISMMAVLHENLTIPEKMGINKTDLDPYLEGLLVFDEDTNYFEVAPEDLYTNSTMEFYGLAYDLKSVPLICRSFTDISPEPRIESIFMSKRIILTPKFLNINQTIDVTP